MTTRGFTSRDFRLVATLIDGALKNRDNADKLAEIRQKVLELTREHPLPY